MINIKYAPPAKGLAQAYSYGALISVVSAKNEQILPFVFCADFLNEVFSSVVAKAPRKIYGFSYDANTNLLPCDKYTKILITHDSKDLLSNREAALVFLNEFESRVGLKKSNFFLCNKHPIYKSNLLLVKADKRIRNSIVLLTAWRMVLRNSFGVNPDLDFDKSLSNFKESCFIEQDKSYFNNIEAFIKYIQEKDKDFVNYFDKEDFLQEVSSVHNYSGVVNFFGLYKGGRYNYNPKVPWQKRIVEKMA